MCEKYQRTRYDRLSIGYIRTMTAEDIARIEEAKTTFRHPCAHCGCRPVPNTGECGCGNYSTSAMAGMA